MRRSVLDIAACLLAALDSLAFHRSRWLLRARVALLERAARSSLPVRSSEAERVLSDPRVKTLRTPVKVADLACALGTEEYRRWRWSPKSSAENAESLGRIAALLTLGVEASSGLDRVRRELSLADVLSAAGCYSDSTRHVEHALAEESTLPTPDPETRYQLERLRSINVAADDPDRGVELAQDANAGADRSVVGESSLLGLEVRMILWTWRARRHDQAKDSDGLSVAQPNDDLVDWIARVRREYSALDRAMSPDALLLEFVYCLVLWRAQRFDDLLRAMRWLMPLLRGDPSKSSQEAFAHLKQIEAWVTP